MDDEKLPILAVIAKNVIEIRKNIGLTQEQLANRAGIDRSYMGYIENAKHNVTVGMLERIANALEVDIAELLERR